MERSRRLALPVQDPSAFAGFGCPPEVILLAVRWYLRYGLSYRDPEELLAERSINVDRLTLYRWVQRFMPELIDAARPNRHAVGDRWFVDETHVKVNGVWRYVYRASDHHGQVISVFVSHRRDFGSARRFFTTALARPRCAPSRSARTPPQAPQYRRSPAHACPPPLHRPTRGLCRSGES